MPRGKTTESDGLRRSIAALLPPLINAGRALSNHPQINQLYPDYLLTMHWIIRASVPLMEAARERAETMAQDDPVSARLAVYLRGHISEELHHDDWLLDDLEVLGHDRTSTLNKPPSPTVAGLVGAQYYWIFHYHPVALLGYM